MSSEVDHPEFLEARRVLLSSNEKVGSIIRVYSPGDPAAERDRHGKPRVTVVYLRSGPQPKPCVALLHEGRVLEWREGW